MTGRPGRATVAPALDAALREFVNALGKAAMYPPGHRFVMTAAAALTERLQVVLTGQESFTLGVTPRGLLFDGVAHDALPSFMREFAARLHRKNIGTIHCTEGITLEDVTAMLQAIAKPDADETTGRQGFRRPHLRIDPLVYDVLAFADGQAEQDLDDLFWRQLVEAAFDRHLAEGEGTPTVPQLVEAITERATHGDGARRVFEALTAFASAVASRGDRGGGARRHLVDVLTALSRPTTARVVGAAPGPGARRRFLRDTLQLVPPALLLQLLEVVAEADGEPISHQLRYMLGKMAGDGGSGSSGGHFALQVLGLLEQWDGGAAPEDELADPRLGLEPARVLALGLEIGHATDPVVEAAQRLVARGQVPEMLHLLDLDGNDPAVVRTIADTALDPALLDQVLATTPIDFVLVDRIVSHAGARSVGALLSTLGSSEDRSTRRRLIEMLARLGPEAQSTLLDQLDGAPWYLARNILVVLGQSPTVAHPERVAAALRHEEPRVRQEALKVLLRQEGSLRERIVAEVLDAGDPTMVRTALTALEGRCPPRLVGPVAATLLQPHEDIRLLALHALSEADNPVIVPQLLSLVRTAGGFFRRIRLEPPTPVMLAALTLLARRWPTHRQVGPVLQLAARSSDPAIRETLARVSR